MTVYTEISNPLWLSRYDRILLLPNVVLVTSLKEVEMLRYKFIIKTKGYGLSIKTVEKILERESGMTFGPSVSVDYALKGNDGLMEYCLKVEF